MLQSRRGKKHEAEHMASSALHRLRGLSPKEKEKKNNRKQAM
jgi:hypothetical protein